MYTLEDLLALQEEYGLKDHKAAINVFSKVQGEGEISKEELLAQLKKMEGYGYLPKNPSRFEKLKERYRLN